MLGLLNDNRKLIIETESHSHSLCLYYWFSISVCVHWQQ